MISEWTWSSPSARSAVPRTVILTKNVSSGRLTVADPSARSAIRDQHTDTRAGALAAKEDNYKRRHFRGTFVGAISTLVPFAIQSYGRLGKSTDHFLKVLADLAAQATDQHRSQLLFKRRQLTSVRLQCAMSCRRELGYVASAARAGTAARGGADNTVRNAAADAPGTGAPGQARRGAHARTAHHRSVDARLHTLTTCARNTALA